MIDEVNSLPRRHSAQRTLALRAAVAAALALPAMAGAFEIPTGNEDLSVRLDNTVRLNVTSRVADEDKAILANPNTDDGGRNFPQGSLFTRVDLLTEFDVVWKRSLGFRVSAASWWDGGYDVVDNTSVATSNHLQDGLPALGLPAHTKRYAEGPSAEFLDVFAFGKFDVGNVPVNVKLGQTTVYWGEGLLMGGAFHGVSYGQNPLDLWKGLATPGAEVKELFRPRVGFNVQSTLTDTLSVAAQYFFNWQGFDNQAYRLPESGSYLNYSDAIVWGGESFVFAPNPFAALVPGAPAYLRAWRGEDIEPEENSGNYGLAVRWSPEWLDGTLGVYYRRTYDMLAQLMLTPGVVPGVTLPPAACTGIGGAPLPNNNCIVNTQATNAQDLLGKGKMGLYNAAFGEDIDIYGLSLSKQVAGISLGAELSYRQNMPLISDPVWVLPPALVSRQPGAIATTDVPESGTPGALGDTMHGVVNLLGVIGESPLWDTASWNTELTWMTWLDVTQNEAVFKGRKAKAGQWAAYEQIDAVDKNFYGLAVNFTPTWFQVRPGMDLMAPLSWSQGISGNAAVSGGGNEEAGSYAIGIAADFYQKYRLDLKYVDFFGEYSKAPNGAAAVYNGVLPVISDRDFVSLTFKMTF
jgi:hypothetical protein